MTGGQATLLWIYAAIVAVWPIRLLVLEIILRRLEVLTPESPRFQQPAAPLVSAILPAKDEEAYLAECIESIRGQTYPSLEVLVVDDRSIDRTYQIARGFAERDGRIRVLSITDLPAGWTGKTHALKRAAGEARGEWLWFMDADTLHAREALAILMEHARSHRAALVSILPELRCESFWEQVVQPLGAIVLMQSFPLHHVNDDQSPLAFANGQSILVERTAYDSAGGHEAVRDRFVEDIALAGRVKGLGLPIRVSPTRGIATCRMYSSLAQLVRGWSRILYDALDRSALRLIVRLLDPLIFCQAGHVALAAGVALLAAGRGGSFAVWLLGLSLVHHVWMYLVMRRVYGMSVPGSRYAAWYPLANLVVDLFLLRALRMCLTGNVTWRGTRYGVKIDTIQGATTMTSEG